MGLCLVSRTLGLQRIDGCRSQPVQARKRKNKNGGKAVATVEGKRSERVGGRRGRERGRGWGPEECGAHLWVHTGELPEGHFEEWVTGEGIKRWGIEAIRTGTFDRFGRGRGKHTYIYIYTYTYIYIYIHS